MGHEENAVNARGNSRRNAALAAFLAAALITVGLGLFYRWYRTTHIATDDAFVEGRVHAVSARIPGTVVEVLVEDNQPVRKGAPLLRIDPEPYAVRVRAAAADLYAAAADLEAARSDVAAAREDIAAARAQLASARARVEAARANVVLADATLSQAERDAERARSLFEKHAVSRERFERARTERDVASARAEAAREDQRLAGAAVTAQEAQVARMQAALAQRRAKVGQKDGTVRKNRSSLEEAKLNRRYTEVTAPADGLVTRKNVEAGQVVRAGQPLLTVASLADVWIVANYKETQISRIRPGSPVAIKVDTYPGRTFRGRVDSIMAGTGSAFSLFPPENATGNYVKVVQRVPVKIRLEPGEDPGHVLRIGMSVVPTVLVR